MKISDWNRSLLYAKQIVRELDAEGIDTNYTVYTQSGDRGIYLNVLDIDGNVYDQYASGIHSAFIDMQAALYKTKKRILKKNK